MKNLKTVLVCFVALALTNCKSGKPDNFDYGKIVDNTYTNEFFEMSMDIPEDMYVMPQTDLDNMAKQGAEIFEDDALTQARLKASEINTANLLSILEFDPNSNPTSFNGNVVMVAENTAMAIGIDSGEDYLKASKKMLQQTKLNYSFDEDGTGTETFGGQEFDYMDAAVVHGGIEVKQRYYSTIINDFSLNVIISYVTEDQKESLTDILKSMDF